MVSIPLKHIGQNGNLPQVGVNIKNVWNHQLAKFLLYIACLGCLFFLWGAKLVNSSKSGCTLAESTNPGTPMNSLEFGRHLTTSRHPTKPPWKGWYRHPNLTFSHTKRTGNLGPLSAALTFRWCLDLKVHHIDLSVASLADHTQRVSQSHLLTWQIRFSYLRPRIMVQWKRRACCILK